MEVGVEYDSFFMGCNDCSFVWLFVMQIDIIYWGDGDVEEIYSNVAVCPHCGHENEIQIDL
jgi:hypothetical protein